MAKKLGEKISTHMVSTYQLSFSLENMHNSFLILNNEYKLLVQYTQLMMAMEHLISLPGSATQNDFIMQWREPIAAG